MLGFAFLNARIVTNKQTYMHRSHSKLLPPPSRIGCLVMNARPASIQLRYKVLIAKERRKIGTAERLTIASADKGAAATSATGRAKKRTMEWKCIDRGMMMRMRSGTRKWRWEWEAVVGEFIYGSCVFPRQRIVSGNWPNWDRPHAFEVTGHNGPL